MLRLALHQDLLGIEHDVLSQTKTQAHFHRFCAVVDGCYGMHNSEQARFDGYVILLGATARQSDLA